MSKVITKIEDRDRGFAKIRDMLNALPEESVFAGILDPHGSGTTPTFIDRRTGEPLPGNETVAHLFSYHEFGSGVPKRSVLRRGFDSKRVGAGNLARRSLSQAIARRAGAKVTRQKMGEFYVKTFFKLIEKRKLKPLAPATKADPGRDKNYIPLWDTGQIISNLRWKESADE